MTSPLAPQAASLIQESPTLSNLASITVLQPFYYLVQQTIHWLFMGYLMTVFCLFTWDKWFKVYKSTFQSPVTYELNPRMYIIGEPILITFEQEIVEDCLRGTLFFFSFSFLR